ncbi:MAG: tetratricopeptide repeat protein, partial [Bacteroidales bacterium]
MKVIRSVFYIVIAGASVISACSRQLVPGLRAGKAGPSYDSAAYNYDFVEAIRQKMLGNFAEAMKDFEQCIALNPRSDASYYQMAQMVLSNGDLDSGKEYMKKAYELSPGNLWYSKVLAGIYYQHREIDSAIIVYEAAIKEYPEKTDLQLSLANLYSENQNYEKARNILNKLNSRYGVNETTTEALARTLIAEHKYRDALE